MPTEGVVICTYGPSGIGKTVDMGYSFPSALFLAAPGALLSIEKVCGFEPDRVEASTIPEATELLRKAKKAGYKAIVIDDFSFLAEQTFSVFEKKYAGFGLWGALRDAALDLRNEARFSEMIVAMNAWEQPPQSKAGKSVRGGPRLPGTLPEAVPALCDIVLRAVHEPKRRPWPSAYRCRLSAEWTMKDRYDVATVCDPAPMNIAELLRASGFKLDRRPEVDKYEGLIQTLSESFTGTAAEDDSLANKVYSGLIEKGETKFTAKWVVRDAVDRAVIRRAMASAEAAVFTSPPVLG